MNKEIMKMLRFDREIRLIEEGKCPNCESYVDLDEFRDKFSLKEYYISGLCQKCQDEVFNFEW